MTLSLAGRCQRTGAVGAVITSSSIAVASRCLWVSVHGVALSQNVTDPALGLLGLRHLEGGHDAPQVLERMVAGGAYSEWRQLGVLDRDGQSAHFTGAQGLGIVGTAQGQDCLAMGNLLAHADVPQAMVHAFEQSGDLHLAERLMRALEAGVAAGGEAGPVHAAGLKMHWREGWPVADLRVDWSETPITQLRAAWTHYEPQMNDYILRAKDPTRAPSYGVPGDE
jgi:uncharacterized Ntn-hydrolase superfamily protein